LSAVEPSAAFLENVMGRIARPEPVVVGPSRGSSWGTLKDLTIFVGALILAVAYLFPAAGRPWLSNLPLSVGVVRSLEISAYLTVHPPWAVLLAGFAALLILLGLAVPGPRVRASVSHAT
jgi:hypothetical protein